MRGRLSEDERTSQRTPVAGRRFDRIVANPPFVVGPPETGHSYRESGLKLDGASRTVVSGAPQHLADGGTAVLLASWVEREDSDWRAHVSSWVPAEGVDAWEHILSPPTVSHHLIRISRLLFE